MTMNYDYIKQGDCLELIQDIPDHSIDMILCDPPYGIDFQSARIKDKSKRKKKILNDKTPFLSFIPLLPRILKPTSTMLLFTRWDVQQQFIDALQAASTPPRSIIIWDKVNHGMGDLKRTPSSRYESIIYYSGNDFRFQNGRPEDIVRFSRVPASRLVHPNEKPVELLEHLIRSYSSEGDVVLDLCMGSGSTCLAAKNTGRHYIGFELDEEYFHIAQERLK